MRTEEIGLPAEARSTVRGPARFLAGSTGRPWDDDDLNPDRETWDPEPLDDEPDPEPGDFWLEPDAFDE